MDVEEVVDLIIESFHTTVSDDDYVNEQSARASIWDLVEKYGDTIAAAEASERDQATIDDLRMDLESAKDYRSDLEIELNTLRKRLEEAEVQLA